MVVAETGEDPLLVAVHHPPEVTEDLLLAEGHHPDVHLQGEEDVRDQDQIHPLLRDVDLPAFPDPDQGHQANKCKYYFKPPNVFFLDGGTNIGSDLEHSPRVYLI